MLPRCCPHNSACLLRDRTIQFIPRQPRNHLETRRIHPLTNSRPLRQLYDTTQISPSSNLLTTSTPSPPHSAQDSRAHSLCTPFRYLFSFRSNIVYLSRGTISSSRGISSFHRSTAFADVPCFASALSTTAITLSTMRRRFRWRAFCGRESRQGIFLGLHGLVLAVVGCWGEVEGGTIRDRLRGRRWV